MRRRVVTCFGRLARTRAVRLANALVVMTAASAWAIGAATTANGDVTFTATSAAQGSQVELQSNSIPLSTDTTGGGPTAQTLLDSNGTSRAYAASPDPSQTGATGPALACSLSGLPVPPAACTYPLFVTTDRGQPPQTAGSPGNTVSADSEDASTSASGDVGQAPGPTAKVSSTSRVMPNGSVTTRAETVTDAFTVGAVVMRGLSVMAEADYADGKVTTKQELAASQVDVSGQTFGFSNGVFTLPGGSSVPVPSDTVFGLMKQAGVTAHFQQPQQTATGVVSASLSFSYDIPAAPGTAPAHVSVTFGQASANIMGSTAPDTPTATDAAGTDTTPIVTGGDQGAPGGTAALGASAPAVPATDAVAPAVSSSPAPAVRPATPAPAPAPAGGTTSLAAVRSPVTHKLSNVYLALVAAAILTFGTATALRILGVKLPWRT